MLRVADEGLSVDTPEDLTRAGAFSARQVAASRAPSSTSGRTNCVQRTPDYPGPQLPSLPRTITAPTVTHPRQQAPQALKFSAVPRASRGSRFPAIPVEVRS